MTTMIATKVSLNRGTPRIWLEGLRLVRGQFAPATRYNVFHKDGTVTLKACKDGTRKVSARKEKPIIDLCSQIIGQWFPVGTKLKAVVRKGRIVIRRLANAVKALKRDRDLIRKIRAGEPLDVVSMFAGGGVLDAAVHRGLNRAGIKARAHLVAEIDGRYADAYLRANANLIDDDTIMINGPVQDFDIGGIQSGQILACGLPCTGMSKAGRSKRKLSCAEEHPEAGALFFTTLQWIGQMKDGLAAILIECTPELLTSPSLSVIRSVLLSWGYDLWELNLNGNEMGALENRNRACIIAMSHELAEASGFSENDIRPIRTKEDTLADIMEPVSAVDSRWKTFDYLVAKQERDVAQGKGFRRQIYTGKESHINTLTRDIAKCRSTDPMFQHPTNPKYTRLPTVLEHARVKGVSDAWIKACGVANSVAHQILGQSVVAPAFEAVAMAVGNALAAATRALTTPTHTEALAA